MVIKQILGVFIFICLSLSLSACQQSASDEAPVNKMVETHEKTTTAGASASIMKKEMIEMHGKITNGEAIASFMESVVSKKQDALRLTRYTTEGDPIYYELSYNGADITFTIDNSNDAYAGSGKGPKQVICAEMEKKETDSLSKYVLTGCSGESSTRIFFELEKSQEAAKMPADFNFVLRHGVGAKNIVDTFTHKLTKDLIANGQRTVDQFHLSEAQMKDIYAEMLRRNVLSPKKLTAESNCRQIPFPSYYLKIQMNGEVRDLSWSKENCEYTEDAAALTELVDFIWKIVTETEAYKKMPESSGGYE